MIKVFAVHEGAAIQIGRYGIATKDRGVAVPEAVAAELKSRTDLRVERAKDASVGRAKVAAPAPVAKAEGAKG